MTADPAEVIRRFVADVWNGERLPTAYDFVGPDLPGLDGVGPEATLAWHADRRTSFPDLVYEIVDLVADGDQVAFRWEANGTQHGAFGPVPATARTGRYRGATFSPDDEGQVVQV
jgi:hypothetical protein